MDTNKGTEKKGNNLLRGLLDGSLITKNLIAKNLPFVLYITVIAVIYIGNSYHAEKIKRDIVNLQKNIKDLRSEAITLQSELMYVRRQAEISRLIEKHNLDFSPSEVPPFKIIFQKDKNK